jgi:hypothetical protein
LPSAWETLRFAYRGGPWKVAFNDAKERALLAKLRALGYVEIVDTGGLVEWSRDCGADHVVTQTYRARRTG